MILTEKMVFDFGVYLFENEKSELTIEKYIRDVGFFLRFTGGRETDKAMVLAYKSYLEQQYAVASANSMIASVNAFLRFLGLTEFQVRQFKVQKQIFRPAQKELSKAEYIRLCRTAEASGNERLSMILQTVCGTGIRISELKFITVKAVKSAGAVVSCKNKTRTVFIVRELQKKLLRYCRKNGIESGAVFVTRTGKPMNRTNVWREMKGLCERAGVDPGKVFPHNLRHLFAKVFYEIEKDIAKLADILGHSSINTTRIYIISTGTEHRSRMEKMGLILLN